MRVLRVRRPILSKPTLTTSSTSVNWMRWGDPPRAMGEALILRPDGRGAAPIVARVKIDEWMRLE
jgi:hypothetical protein